jgi:hypothetical protein
MANGVIEISQQEAQDIANVLLVSESPTCRAMAEKLKLQIGGWSKMPTLKPGFGDVSVGPLIEL